MVESASTLIEMRYEVIICVNINNLSKIVIIYYW